MLTQMRKKIDQSLDTFLSKAYQDYRLDQIDPILFHGIRDFILRPGKRIRPLLLICSYKGYCRKRIRMTPSIYYVSTCIELLHNFMLIHDDIIDRSDLRRGKPTMHKMMEKAAKASDRQRLGTDLSIVVGDIVYALAIDAFLSINEHRDRKERALKYFIQTAVFTAMGEFIDTLHGTKTVPQVSEKDVFLNYSLKTARYTFDCPLVVGAILAGAGEQDIQLLAELGLLIGQAFQIQDDIIGVFDTQKNIGKSILSDIAESKKTLLVCHAYSQLQGKHKARFMEIFTKPKITHKDLLAVRKIFIETGSLAYSLDHILTRLRKSEKIFQQLQIKEQYRRYVQRLLLELFHQSRTIADQNGLPF